MTSEWGIGCCCKRCDHDIVLWPGYYWSFTTSQPQSSWWLKKTGSTWRSNHPGVDDVSSVWTVRQVGDSFRATFTPYPWVGLPVRQTPALGDYLNDPGSNYGKDFLTTPQVAAEGIETAESVVVNFLPRNGYVECAFYVPDPDEFQHTGVITFVTGNYLETVLWNKKLLWTNTGGATVVSSPDLSGWLITATLPDEAYLLHLWGQGWFLMCDAVTNGPHDPFAVAIPMFPTSGPIALVGHYSRSIGLDGDRTSYDDFPFVIPVVDNPVSPIWDDESVFSVDIKVPTAGAYPIKGTGTITVEQVA